MEILLDNSHLQVLRPIKKIKRIYESENVNKPDQNYIGIVTVEIFNFGSWGFYAMKKLA